MMSLPLSLALMACLLGAEWLYVRAFFGTIEPALIARVETALDIRIGFGLLHHWEVREAESEQTESSHLGKSAAVSAIHLAVMLAFAVGLLAIAGAIFAPAILWFRLRS